MAIISQLHAHITTFPLSFTPLASYHRQRTSFSIAGSTKQQTLPFISCNAKDPSQTPPLKLDRRDILIGLGGLSAASAARAAPIDAPDISTCGAADLPSGAKPTNCCPPPSSSMADFILPHPSSPIRIRPAAHLVDDEYLAKFSRAVALMRALPPDDPRSFTQQANIHCAYCDGGYEQLGFPSLELQIHNSWLFMPWHRCYLYFYERILGKLINDDSFAMPFWNYDSPAGMTFPPMYTADPTSPLFDTLRDREHAPPALIDLDFDGDDRDYTPEEQIERNLKVMYRQIVSNSPTARLFFGNPYRAGDGPSPGGGSVENIPHGTVHVWAGDRLQPDGEDMGNLYSAARDPMFFAHHANVDRMWDLWKGLGGKRADFTDSDWLDTAFAFYDENAELVRIKVRDCVSPERMRYSYQGVDVPWLQARPARRAATTMSMAKPKPAMAAEMEAELPVTLRSAVRVRVKRVKGLMKGLKRREEVLVVEGIELERDVYVKFDVYVNTVERERVGPEGREMAGSFVSVPHKHKHDKMGKGLKTRLQLCISELVEDIGAGGDESLVVTLVPRKGVGRVRVESVRIELAD